MFFSVFRNTLTCIYFVVATKRKMKKANKMIVFLFNKRFLAYFDSVYTVVFQRFALIMDYGREEGLVRGIECVG